MQTSYTDIRSQTDAAMGEVRTVPIYQMGNDAQQLRQNVEASPEEHAPVQPAKAPYLKKEKD